MILAIKYLYAMNFMPYSTKTNYMQHAYKLHAAQLTVMKLINTDFTS